MVWKFKIKLWPGIIANNGLWAEIVLVLERRKKKSMRY